MRLIKTLLTLIVCSIFSASFCFALVDKNVIKVGFLAVGPISDFGWNYSTNQGRLYLEKKMGANVQTIIAEKIPESAEADGCPFC